MQQRLKFAAGVARAQIVTAELFAELDVAMDDAAATPDLGFAGKDFRRLRVTLKQGRSSKC